MRKLRNGPNRLSPEEVQASQKLLDENMRELQMDGALNENNSEVRQVRMFMTLADLLLLHFNFAK
jgi:hypothetical protein